MATITHYKIHGTGFLNSVAVAFLTDRRIDIRFPTSTDGSGTDAMYEDSNPLLFLAELLTLAFGFRNTECDYSSAYISLYTSEDPKLAGHGQVTTIFFNF